MVTSKKIETVLYVTYRTVKVFESIKNQSMKTKTKGLRYGAACRYDPIFCVKRTFYIELRRLLLPLIREHPMLSLCQVLANAPLKVVVRAGIAHHVHEAAVQAKSVAVKERELAVASYPVARLLELF